MASHGTDLARAVPHLVEAAEAYRMAVEKHNSEADNSKRRLDITMTAVIAAVNNVKALGMDIGDDDYRNSDDISRVLDTMKIIVRQVSLKAIV